MASHGRWPRALTMGTRLHCKAAQKQEVCSQEHVVYPYRGMRLARMQQQFKDMMRAQQQAVVVYVPTADTQFPLCLAA